MQNPGRGGEPPVHSHRHRAGPDVERLQSASRLGSARGQAAQVRENHHLHPPRRSGRHAQGLRLGRRAHHQGSSLELTRAAPLEQWRRGRQASLDAGVDGAHSRRVSASDRPGDATKRKTRYGIDRCDLRFRPVRTSGHRQRRAGGHQSGRRCRGYRFRAKTARQARAHTSSVYILGTRLV